MTGPKSQAHVSVATEAADWYARLRAQDVSELEAVRFRAWLAGDPARRREFEAIDTFWDDLAAIETSPEVLRVRADLSARRRHKNKWHARPWAVAATLVIAVGGAWFAWQQWNTGRYVTDVGEQRTVPLADGSLITLNTATEIRLHYSETLRGVELVRGQANFEVAKDPKRPFIVTAGGGAVRAMGTIFDVYKATDKVTVTLIEGKVAVTPHEMSSLPLSALEESKEPAAREGEGLRRKALVPAPAETPKAAEIILAAGEQLSYATTAGVVKLASADVPRVTAWRARKLDFSDTPLLEAIAEANRYSRDQIVLEAPELMDARISGAFEAGKSDLFVEGLQTYFRLNVERGAGHRIILTTPTE